MTIFLNDERDYTPVVEAWVREFFCTMDEDDSDEVEVIPFEDNNSTELDHEFVYDLIFNIAKRDEYEPTTAKLSTDENGKANWPFPK